MSGRARRSARAAERFERGAMRPTTKRILLHISSPLLTALQEVQNLLPDFRRLKHDGAVIAFGEFPKPLGALIGFIQPAADTFGDDCIATCHEHGDRAVIIAQMGFGWKSVDEQEADGKNHHMRLGYGNKAVVSAEQNDTFDYMRMFACEIGCDTGAERFAVEVGREIRWQQDEGFIGG